ncbi:MAG: exonuclease domain-containing protein [Acidimicrobiales bacterium]
MGWRDGPLLGFDLETTGLGVHEDLPVQVGLVWTMPGEVVTADAFLVDPACVIPDEAIAVHGITTARARAEGCCLDEAAARIHAAVGRASAEGVPVVAMNASFDVTIAEELFRLCELPPLAWEVLIDPLVMDRRVVPERSGKRHLEALCDYYGIVIENAHDAVADAAAAVGVARQIGKYFGELGDLEPAELTTRQAYWHREWAVGQDTWLRDQELPGLEPEEFVWPCRLGPTTSLACAAASATTKVG